MVKNFPPIFIEVTQASDSVIKQIQECGGQVNFQIFFNILGQN